jgi:hypothetical protein
MCCRTERGLDQSGIPIAPPKRVRAATSTIVAAPAHAQSARIRRVELEDETDTDTNTNTSTNDSSESGNHGDEIEYGSNDGRGDDNNEHEREHDTNVNEDEDYTNEDGRDMDEDERVTSAYERITSADERVTSVDERITSADERVMSADECDMDEDERVTNVDENEVGENKAGESEAGEDGYWGGSEHRRRMEYGQGTEGYDDRDEIGDRPTKSVIAQAEAEEQRARAEIREQRALAEAWEQPYQAGRTHSTATPAKSGGKVQQLMKIPAIGLGHSGSAHLPPSMWRAKASVLKAEIVATGGLEPDSSNQSIPLDRNAIFKHYVESSLYKKRGRSTSPESQHNKSRRISASYSSAITRNPSPSVVPSTKWSTKGPSPSVLPSTKLSTRDPSPVPNGKRAVRDLSPLVDHDPQGSSSTTGGVFRGRAVGGGFRFADASKLMPILMPAYYNIFCPSRTNEC